MRGGDTTALRAYNERLVMHALLQAGMLSKAEIARETGLSGQAASVIVNRLLEDGLLVKLDKVRGQVGQPSTPIAPNPEGAYSLGVKIGRRSVESILINLLGEELGASRVRYDAPLPEPTIATAIAQAAGLLAHLLRQSQTAGVASFAQFVGVLTADACQLALRHALASASLCVMEQGCVPPGWAAARAWSEQHPAAQDPH